MEAIVSKIRAKKFRVEVMRLYASMYVGGYASREEVRTAATSIMGTNGWFAVVEYVGICWGECKGTIDKYTKHIYGKCKSAILNHKKFRDNMLSDNKIPTTPLTLATARNACELLMFKNEEAFTEWIPFAKRLHLGNYFLRVEVICRLAGIFESELADRHQKLLERLKIDKNYRRLFLPNQKIRDVLSREISGVPMVLVEIIMSYLVLNCLDPSDEDEIYSRLLRI